MPPFVHHDISDLRERTSVARGQQDGARGGARDRRMERPKREKVPARSAIRSAHERAVHGGSERNRIHHCPEALGNVCCHAIFYMGLKVLLGINLKEQGVEGARG